MKPRPETFYTYWYFAAERQNIFFNKINHITPLTQDPILQQYKFCNTYRASDRVSQFLIKEVIYSHQYDPISTAMRVILFRLLNKCETWEYVESQLGEPITIRNFSVDRIAKILTKRKEKGKAIYGNAFILASTEKYASHVKHVNHLRLIEEICLKTKYINTILSSTSLKQLYLYLHSLPMIGDFMAYQLAIDLNYSDLFQFDEDDFTIAGPGAVRGIAKCFLDTGRKDSEYIIQWMVDHQEELFNKYNLHFKSLCNRRLHTIDCQGLFCETDKYCRVNFPHLASNRVRIKTKYLTNNEEIQYFYPPKWHLDLSLLT